MTASIPEPAQPTALEARRAEVAQYQANIDRYTAIAANLPDVWPAHLVHLKGAPDRHKAAAGVEDINDVKLLGKLWAHDMAQDAIRAEIVEQTVAQSWLDVLEAEAQG